MPHTPGPWEAGRSDMATFVDGVQSKCIYAGEQYVAVASGHINGDWKQVIANAKLIAAAPELLNMVQEFIFTLQDEHGSYYVDGNIIKGKALWEKATGETWKDEELEEDEDDNEVDVEVEGEQS